MSAQDDARTNQRDAMRDAATDAMDVYLMDGVEAVEAWIGRSIKGRRLDSAVAYTLGCALIHAAHLIAQAITKQDEAPGQAQKASCVTSHAEGVRPEAEPAAKSPTVRTRDPELLRMDRESALATPMPKNLKEKAASWKREAVSAGHYRSLATR